MNEAEVAGLAVDLTDVTTSILGLLGAALTGLATFGINWVRQKIGLERMQQDDVVRRYLTEAVDNGVASLTRRIVGDDGAVSVEIENDIIRGVIRYLKNRVPDALERFGFTEADIEEMVRGRLARYLEERER